MSAVVSPSVAGRAGYRLPSQVVTRRIARALLGAGLASGAAIGGLSPSAALAAPTGAAAAAPVTTTEEKLLQKLEAMEKRIKGLEQQLKQKQASEGGGKPSKQPVAASEWPSSETARPTGASLAARATATAADVRSAPAGIAPPPDKAILGLVDSPVSGLSIGAYGEVKFGAVQNPAANGQWQKGFDANRIVLLPTYAITPNIIFNAEIEFEHGGIAFDNDDKKHGAIEIEQLFIDFKVLDQFNWRAPGIDLVPIGYTNQHHEPTQFYSVNRPELYNGLIPSTFWGPATSIYGRIADGVTYQVQVSSSIEDYGDDFGRRTDANTVPLDAYTGGFSGTGGLALSRPVVGDFRQLNNELAYSGRLDVAPAFIPGFAASVSAYYSGNTTPRGAHDDLGNLLGRSSLTLFDTEFRYRVQGTGLELRGEYVQARFGNPANLRANNDSDPTNNVGKMMYGYSGEIAYHFALGNFLNSDWEAVPFYRYTHQNLQTGGFAGTDLNMPIGAGQVDYHSAGVAVFPAPKVVLKATYQKVISRQAGGAQSDSALGGVGFFF
ncbi:MAG: hypothetical protein AB1586_30155 [Pseudomonadota bacterium]